MTIAVNRRFALALASLLLAFALLRPVIAIALVTRGDQFLFRGDLQDAKRYYRRALALDDDCEPAIERFLFVQLQARGKDSLPHGRRIADAYLERNPLASQVRLARAFMLWASSEYAPAAADFMLVAHEQRDFRYYALAAHAALRAGERTLARSAFTSALRLEPRYTVGRRYLRLTAR